ncbi:hypothetical protein PLESTM_000053900 [Pleodorina starrii]|nr:hypothetical protein PLESTM_000053900 [Pleodorina starrii]
MSQMGSTLQNLQDENTALKAHVSKLQSHIQSMTLKVYEVTAKYESTLAENAQLRSEMLRFRRPSAPGAGDSSYMAPAASGATAGNGPNSAPLNQLSPFVAPMELGAGAGGPLSAGHVHLRSSSPMNLQQQRQALEEVVMLLKEHKRRNQGTGQDLSGGSEIGSSGAGINNRTTSTHSPTSDTPMAAAGAPPSGLGASRLGTNNSVNSGMPYNVGDMPRFLGGDGLGVPSVGSGLHRGCHSEILPGSFQQQQPQQQQLQQPLHLHTCSHLGPGDHGALCSSGILNAHNNLGGQGQQLSQQLLGNQGPATTLSLPLPAQQQQQAQLPQTLGQSHSHPLAQLQMPYQQQLCLNQQQQMQAVGSGALYGTMSSLSLSAPFYSAVSTLPGGGSGGSGLQMTAGHNSGPTALGSGIGGIGNGAAGMAAAQGMGAGGGLDNHHRSASYALERQACATSAHNVVAMHPTWQGNAGNNAAGVAMLRPEDLTEDILMSLDEYVPQDL